MEGKVILEPCKARLTRKRQETQFLFVHNDTQPSQQTANPAQVRAHVQKLYRKRKSGMTEQWRPSLAGNSKQMKLRMKNGTIEVAHGYRHREPSSKTMKAGSIRTAFSKLTVPEISLAIQEGNSDPFDAMPVRIDSRLSTVIAWHRAQGIPALNPVEAAIVPAPTPSMVRTWKNLVFSMQNRDVAYSYLASVCALMGRKTGDRTILEMALRLTDQGYVNLRRKLTRSDLSADFVTRSMILNMFWAELAAGRPLAARTHLSMLNQIMQKLGQDIKLHPECKLKYLAADTNLAVWQMWMPVQVAKHPSVERYFEDWKLSVTNDVMSEWRTKALDVHISVKDAILRQIFSDIRELALVADLAARRVCNDSTIFQWMDARLLSCESRLVAFCVDRETWKVFEPPDPVISSMRVDYCTALAALVWISSTWASSNRKVGPSMTQRLQIAVASNVQTDPHLILWILYAGACVEAQEVDSEHLWFTQRLHRKIGEIGLPQATQLLRQFLYMDNFDPLAVATRPKTIS